MTDSIGPFHVTTVGPTTVLRFDSREAAQEMSLIEYKSPIAELTAQHRAEALAIDMTGVQSLSRPLIGLVTHLMRTQPLSIQLLNVSEEVQQTPNAKELDALVEFLEVAQSPTKRMQHLSVRQSDDHVDLILLSVVVLQDSLVIEQMEGELLSLVSEDRPLNKILSLRNVNYVGRSGLAMFVKLSTRVTNAGGRLVCCRLSSTVQEAFVVTGINSIIKVTAEESAALEFLNT
jgi:anti-anti-sigma factor